MREVVASADGSETLFGQRAVRLADGVEQVVVAREGPVARVVAPDPVPEVLDRVEFGWVRRQQQDPDVVRMRSFGEMCQPARSMMTSATSSGSRAATSSPSISRKTLIVPVLTCGASNAVLSSVAG
jgi:hypothetical protein